MSATKVTINELYLINPQDWESWYQRRKMPIVNTETWIYVDPKVPNEEVPKLVRPPRPTPDSIKTGANFSQLNAEEVREYKSQMDLWNSDIREYQIRMKAIAELYTDILNTLDKKFHPLIYDLNCHDAFRKLLIHFKPKNEVTEREVVNEWQNLKRKQDGKGRIFDQVEDWLNQWSVTYHKGLQLKLPDVSGTRPIWDFVTAVGLHSNADWGKLIQTSLIAEPEKYKDFNDLVEQFRMYYRHVGTLPRPRGKHAAFAASSYDNDDTNPVPTLNGKDNKGKGRKCICGSSHALRKCWYITDINAPNDWTPNQSTKEQVDKQIASSNKLKRLVEKIIEEAKAKKARGSSTPPTES